MRLHGFAAPSRWNWPDVTCGMSMSSFSSGCAGLQYHVPESHISAKSSASFARIGRCLRQRNSRCPKKCNAKTPSDLCTEEGQGDSLPGRAGRAAAARNLKVPHILKLVRFNFVLRRKNPVKTRSAARRLRLGELIQTGQNFRDAAKCRPVGQS